MSDFEATLRDRLHRNTQLAEQRNRAEEEMDRAAQRAEKQAAAEAADRRRRQDERHAQLARRLDELVATVRQAAPHIDVRAGWSASGEEYLAKLTTTRVRPRRSLTIELDRDDDEVLARWHSAVGDSLELYHLLEFDEKMLQELVLQVVDDELWHRSTTTPAFPATPADPGG